MSLSLLQLVLPHHLQCPSGIDRLLYVEVLLHGKEDGLAEMVIDNAPCVETFNSVLDAMILSISHASISCYPLNHPLHHRGSWGLSRP